jgi:hypothetical protein
MAEADPRPAPRIRRGALLSSVSALGLLVVMFAMKWYGVAGVPDPSAARPAVSSAVDAWNGLSIIRWVMLATVLVTLGSLVLRASQRSHGNKTDTSAIVAALGTLTSALLVYRVLLNPPSPDEVLDQKLGALLGLLLALGIALGGWESVRERAGPERSRPDRPRRRRRLASREDAR